MQERKYYISEASKSLGIEPHVLRYWEEELALEICRNDMGHRYYREIDMKVFRRIQELKEQGFQLKAIKMLIPDLYSSDDYDLNKLLKMRDTLNAQVQPDEDAKTQEASSDRKQETKQMGKVHYLNQERARREKMLPLSKHEEGENVLSNEMKLAQFQNIINQAVAKALLENKQTLGDTVGERVSEEVSQKVSDRVLKQMDYLLRESDDQAEARYRKLDETIREVQKARLEAAAATEKKKKGLFKRRKEEKQKEAGKNDVKETSPNIG